MVDFLLIGPVNSLTYNGVFELIKDGYIGFGWNRVSDFEDGVKFGNIRWFSNISDYYPPRLVLSKKYVEGDYNKYENYDAINVDRTEDIPDYDGVIGVPISFLDKWNPEQFELIGCPWSNVVPDGWNGMSKEFVDLYYEQGNKGQYNEGHIFPSYIKDGKAIIPYTRLLIRKRK